MAASHRVLYILSHSSPRKIMQYSKFSLCKSIPFETNLLIVRTFGISVEWEICRITSLIELSWIFSTMCSNLSLAEVYSSSVMDSQSSPKWLVMLILRFCTKLDIFWEKLERTQREEFRLDYDLFIFIKTRVIVADTDSLESAESNSHRYLCIWAKVCYEIRSDNKSHIFGVEIAWVSEDVGKTAFRKNRPLRIFFQNW